MTCYFDTLAQQPLRQQVMTLLHDTNLRRIHKHRARQPADIFTNIIIETIIVTLIVTLNNYKKLDILLRHLRIKRCDTM